MKKVYCQDCKYAPDNLMFTDYCKYKLGEKNLDMRKFNVNNYCPFYKVSLSKRLINFIENLLVKLRH